MRTIDWNRRMISENQQQDFTIDRFVLCGKGYAYPLIHLTVLVIFSWPDKTNDPEQKKCVIQEISHDGSYG